MTPKPERTCLATSDRPNPGDLAATTTPDGALNRHVRGSW